MGPDIVMTQGAPQHGTTLHLGNAIRIFTRTFAIPFLLINVYLQSP